MALYMSDANGNLNKVAGNQRVVDLSDVYPVGSIYMSINSTSPASLFGGSWTELDNNKALWITSTSSGNANTAISAGLPNISGAYRTSWNDASGGGIITSDTGYSGALSAYHSGTAFFHATGSSTSANHLNWMSLDASRSSAIYGNSITVQPPAYRVYAWRRTA